MFAAVTQTQELPIVDVFEHRPEDDYITRHDAHAERADRRDRMAEPERDLRRTQEMPAVE